MNRTAVIRNLLLGALVTGLAPLTGAGIDAAAAGEAPASALCRSTFGESGPVGGPVVGEGPSGDPMSTTIGWDPFDWTDGLSEIVTCVSVGGRAAPDLTKSMPTPSNDGSFVVSLTLPPAAPGSLVCEQSILVGAGKAADRHRTTSPVCFKLRAGESPPGSGGPAAGRAAAPAPTAPAGPLAPSPKPPSPTPPSPKAPPTATPPATYPASTPPARIPFEAPRGGIGPSSARPGVPDPVAGVAVPAPAWPDPASPAPAAKAGQSAATATAAAAAPATNAPAGAPATALARTGIDEHLPLAGAGGFLALGGAAIIFSAPGRRRPRRRFV